MPRKLRVTPLEPAFRIVLVEPEIPPNTGNISRLCAATQSHLHLCGRLGFRIDEKSVRRAGLDYWPLVRLSVHPDFTDFTLKHKQSRIFLFSANGAKSYLDAGFQPGDSLVFGKESTGLSNDILDRYPDQIYGIPTSGAVRSLNLANAVSIVLYEALRQSGALQNARLESDPPPKPTDT